MGSCRSVSAQLVGNATAFQKETKNSRSLRKTVSLVLQHQTQQKTGKMKWQYKEEHAFEKRRAEGEKIRRKYPDR